MTSEPSENGNDGDGGVGIGDDELPEDLVPSEDNPLAEAPEPGEQVDDLLEDGKPPAEEADETSGDDED